MNANEINDNDKRVSFTIRKVKTRASSIRERPCLSRNFWSHGTSAQRNVTFHRLFYSSDVYNAQSFRDPLHWVPVVSLSWRMRREPLAQVTALLKTMKQTLYERGYGANYLAISRASNKWASPRTSLFLSLSFSRLPLPRSLRLLGPPSPFVSPSWTDIFFEIGREIRGGACCPIVDRFVWP